MAERKNSEARIRANNKYNDKAYDRINIAVPKGQKKRIAEFAQQRGQSVNGFIGQATEGLMALENEKLYKVEEVLKIANEPLNLMQIEVKAKPITGLEVLRAVVLLLDMHRIEPASNHTPLGVDDISAHQICFRWLGKQSDSERSTANE